MTMIVKYSKFIYPVIFLIVVSIIMTVIIVWSTAKSEARYKERNTQLREQKMQDSIAAEYWQEQSIQMLQILFEGQQEARELRSEFNKFKQDLDADFEKLNKEYNSIENRYKDEKNIITTRSDSAMYWELKRAKYIPFK